jgi:hypothetical protein
MISLMRISLGAAVLGCLCLGSGACGARPPAQAAIGDRVSHSEGGFSLVAPPNWQVTSGNRGMSLVRKTPYGGGFPTLNIRRISAAESKVLAVSGRNVDRATGRFTYRYQRWSNSRGQGYRLEAILRTEQGLIFSDASIWDPSPRLNRQFFDEEFWPILNSLEDHAGLQLN